MNPFHGQKRQKNGYERLGAEQEVKKMDKLIQELQMQIKS